MSKKTDLQSVVIHNIKNANFRQIHVDGAHGGITPSGFININFFSQRNAIPKGTEYSLNEQGAILAPLKNIEGSKNGVVREFEFGAYMDINTCKSLKDFLQQKIEEFEAIQNTK